MDKGKHVLQLVRMLGGREIKDLRINELAVIIKADWNLSAKVNPAAAPYLDAMMSLDRISDNYGFDSGKSIVIYFLANAQTWRGPVAKEIKLHLNKIIK